MQLKCNVCLEDIRGETLIEHYKDSHPAAYERYLRANKVAKRGRNRYEED